MLKSRAERSTLGAAPDVAVVDVGLNFLSPQAGLLNHTGKKRMIRASSPHKKPVSILHGRVFFATRPKSEARNRIRIIINQSVRVRRAALIYSALSLVMHYGLTRLCFESIRTHTMYIYLRTILLWRVV